MTAEATVAAAETVCRRWKELSLPFVVMHGLEGYPQKLGRDLDILMRPGDARLALPEAALILRDLGWETRVCPPRLWGRRLVALHENESGVLQYLELHTISSLRWAALPLVDDDERATGVVGCFPVSAWATFAKAILTPSLAGDTDRFDTTYLKGLEQSGVGQEPLVERMAALFGRELSEEVVGAVVAVDAETLQRSAPRLRRAGLRLMMRRPATSLRTMAGLVRQKSGRFASRTGLRVEISFPDEGSADQFMSQIVDQLGRVFPRVTVSRSGSILEKVKQQYSTLSRQGVVLQLIDRPGEGGDAVSVRLSHSPEPGLLWPWSDAASTSGRDDVGARVVSRWIIDQWSSKFPCRGHSDADSSPPRVS